VNSTRGCSKKKSPLLLCPAPQPVLPSASRASLTSFGTASRDVIARRARPRDPSLRSGRQKKGLGATKKTALGDTLGLAQIFKTAPFSLEMLIEKGKPPLALHTLCGLLKW